MGFLLAEPKCCSPREKETYELGTGTRDSLMRLGSVLADDLM